MYLIRRNMSFRTYTDALTHLNSLQSNAATLEALKSKGPILNQQSLPEMRDYLHRIGYSATDLNSLKVIHVAGTKGKGSTSAFCDSILRQMPSIKVGLYTSPHLIQVRERIRINGIPISNDLFVKYFYQVWDRLESTLVRD